jgi:hypothetical protein
MTNQLDVWSRLPVTLPGGHLQPPPNAHMPATLWTPSATPASCGDRSSLKRLPFNWSLSIYGASPSSRWDPQSHLAPNSNMTWHASTTTDPHRNKHLETTTTHGLDSNSTCQLAQPWLLDTYSPGWWSSWDSRHRFSVPSLPSMIILVHRHHDNNALSPLRVASPNSSPPPPLWRRHVRHLHPITPSTDGRPPRGASSRLPGASVASDLRPCSDTNCWN